MKIIVNGTELVVQATNLAALLDELDQAQKMVATALNGEFVPSRMREATLLSACDRVEIVSARQGG